MFNRRERREKRIPFGDIRRPTNARPQSNRPSKNLICVGNEDCPTYWQASDFIMSLLINCGPRALTRRTPTGFHPSAQGCASVALPWVTGPKIYFLRRARPGEHVSHSQASSFFIPPSSFSSTSPCPAGISENSPTFQSLEITPKPSQCFRFPHFCFLFSKFLLFSDSLSQGDCASKPMVATPELPWENCQKNPQLQGSCGLFLVTW
jgi:hypothetical protein